MKVMFFVGFDFEKEALYVTTVINQADEHFRKVVYDIYKKSWIYKKPNIYLHKNTFWIGK